MPAVCRVVAVLLVMVSAAWAQRPPGPPGPYVFDVRGVVIGLPTSPSFYPALRANAIVPARAFGVDVGGHLLFASLGPARLGAGVNLLLTRGTSLDAVASLRVVAPQASVNFGHANGWSYLSAGIGRGRLHGRLASGATGAATLGGSASGSSGVAAGETGLVRNEDVRAGMGVWNVGGGARWYRSRRMAVGFDIRFHKLGQGTVEGTQQVTPGSTAVAVSAGVSLR